MEDLLFDHAVVHTEGRDAVVLDRACVTPDERLNKEQRLQKADGCRADEARELGIQDAAGKKRRDLGVCRQSLGDIHHVRGHDEALVPGGNQVGEVKVGARDVQEHGVAVVDLHVRARSDGTTTGVGRGIGCGLDVDGALGSGDCLGSRVGGACVIDLEGAAVLAAA